MNLPREIAESAGGGPQDGDSSIGNIFNHAAKAQSSGINDSTVVQRFEIEEDGDGPQNVSGINQKHHSNHR